MIEINLKDQHVFITGATRGIGFATAEIFAKAGATLHLNGLNNQRLEQVCETLEAQYAVQCFPYAFDVGQADAVKQAFQKLIKQTKQLDVLVNNAGILEDALLGMATQKNLEQTYATNVFGGLYCSQYAARLMQRQKSGSIINLTSIIGRFGGKGQAVYGGSKAAVIGMTQSLAKELAPQNIRVNAVAPGFIETDMTGQLPDAIYQTRLDSIGLGRIGLPEDIAKVILFLASDLSSYVTGQVIGVDGGMLI